MACSMGSLSRIYMKQQAKAKKPLLLLRPLLSWSIESQQNITMSSSSLAKVLTTNGYVEGLLKKSATEGADFWSFRGIPYAKAPVRFQLPQPSDPWDQVYQAFKCGPDCPQLSMITREVIGQEDNCLTLNIYTRQQSRNAGNWDKDELLLPVLIWIHGGGFSIGSGSDFFYGPTRAMDQPIVLATINYRLGPFGFTNGGGCPSNIGLHDQRLAIQWIKDNARAFGGDPDNITLMGESAGAASVHIQAAAASPHKLPFHKVILQSGTATCPWATTRATKAGAKTLAQRLAEGLNCSGLEDLRRVDSTDLVKAALKINGPMGHNLFLPDHTDSIFFPEGLKGLERPLGVPAIVGINADEGAFGAALFLSSKRICQSLNHPSEFGQALLLGADNASSAAKAARNEYFLDNEVIGWDSAGKLSRLISDAFFVHPFFRLLKATTADGVLQPLFAYKYSHRGEASLPQIMTGVDSFGVSHFDEVLIQFDNKLSPHSTTSAASEKDKRVAGFIWSSWSNFAHKGNPGLHWPDFNSSKGDGDYLEISHQPRVCNGGLVDEHKMAFWDDIASLQEQQTCSKL